MDIENWVEEGIIAASADKGIIARLQFEQLTELKPTMVDGWLWRAWTETAPEKAIEHLQKAVAVSPESELARKFLEVAQEFANFHSVSETEVGTAAAEPQNLAEPERAFAEADESDALLSEADLNLSSTDTTRLEEIQNSAEPEPETDETDSDDDFQTAAEADEERAFVDAGESDALLEATDEAEETISEADLNLSSTDTTRLEETTLSFDDDTPETELDNMQTDSTPAESDESIEEEATNLRDLDLEDEDEEFEELNWSDAIKAISATDEEIEADGDTDSALAAEANIRDVTETAETENSLEAKTDGDEIFAKMDIADQLLSSFNDDSEYSESDTLMADADVPSDAASNAIEDLERLATDEITEDEISQEITALAEKVQTIDEEIRVARGIIPRSPSDQVGGTVLVVDDSPTIRKMTRILLEDAGFTVWTADDGIDATKKLIDGFPNLILLDVRMPRMGGYTLCKLIKSHPDTQDIPVILFSANVLDHIRCSMVRCDDYLAKPFEEDDLLRRVREHINMGITTNSTSSAPELEALAILD